MITTDDYKNKIKPLLLIYNLGVFVTFKVFLLCLVNLTFYVYLVYWGYFDVLCITVMLGVY